MTDPTTLEKRIRRRIIGPPQLFFAATAPGLEALCAAELADLIPGAQLQPLAGGVSFQARLDDGFRALLMLRTANRVLMRIARFQATHFRQLEKALSAVPWELYLAQETPVAVRATARKSRLHHSDAIAQRLTDAVANRRRAVVFAPLAPAVPPRPQRIFVRADHDRFTVSLDASGDLLHKRGLKIDVGPAPLRETLAAAILQQVGYTGDTALLDPMCGAGTFLLEAAMRACRIPAGWYRDFAFTGWPAFRPRRWAYLRRTVETAVRRPAPAPILGFDQDPTACRRVEAALAKGGLGDSVTIQCGDFFNLDPVHLGLPPGLVVINPPYGKRLGAAPESRVLFARVVDRLVRWYPGWKLALIAPPGAERLAPPPLTPRRLPHGGLNLVLFTGTLPR
jgi:putative N6-adenine-specific DNA methylase